MRIAFASEEDNGLDSIVSRKFGRATYFIMVDVEGGNVKSVRTIKNPGAYASGGAAIRAVQELINNNVDVVVAGGFGPNA
ncbi:MAG: iron-molybdenum cofactor-binding protein, partial [Thermoprotei archaeon]